MGTGPHYTGYVPNPNPGIFGPYVNPTIEKALTRVEKFDGYVDNILGN